MQFKLSLFIVGKQYLRPRRAVSASRNVNTGTVHDSSISGDTVPPTFSNLGTIDASWLVAKSVRGKHPKVLYWRWWNRLGVVSDWTQHMAKVSCRGRLIDFFGSFLWLPCTYLLRTFQSHANGGMGPQRSARNSYTNRGTAISLPGPPANTAHKSYSWSIPWGR